MYIVLITHTRNAKTENNSKDALFLDGFRLLIISIYNDTIMPPQKVQYRIHFHSYQTH